MKHTSLEQGPTHYTVLQVVQYICTKMYLVQYIIIIIIILVLLLLYQYYYYYISIYFFLYFFNSKCFIIKNSSSLSRFIVLLVTKCPFLQYVLTSFVILTVQWSSIWDCVCPSFMLLSQVVSVQFWSLFVSSKRPCLFSSFALIYCPSLFLQLSLFLVLVCFLQLSLLFVLVCFLQSSLFIVLVCFLQSSLFVVLYLSPDRPVSCCRPFCPCLQ